jgi:hypothetical protein
LLIGPFDWLCEDEGLGAESWGSELGVDDAGAFLQLNVERPAQPPPLDLSSIGP